MMTIKQFYLLKLAEECAEVAQRASKQMQFGPDEVQAHRSDSGGKDGLLPNKTRLLNEFTDLCGVADALRELGELDLDSVDYDEVIANKKARLKKYLEYSQSLGLVENETIS
jgi:hypothetical protein